MSTDNLQWALDRIEQLTQRGAELTAQRDAALAELAALRRILSSAARRTVCMDGVSAYGYGVGEKVVILRASDIENCVTKREDTK